MAEYKTFVNKISVSPDKKTKQKEYLNKGRLAIVDQGQNLIGGYTDNLNMMVECDLPVIVFGDHTRAVKYITFPFGAGADGIKILKPKENVLPLFLYYATQYIVAKMPDRGYARHYQYVEKEDLTVPSIPEQQRIVSRIEELFSSLDNAVETLQKTKDQLTVYRQAVLKEAFEGEDTWDECNLGSLMTIVRNGYGLKPTDNGEYRILTIGSVRSCSLDLNNFRLNQEPFVEDDQIAENDLLFTRYNGNADFVGCCARVPAITVPYAYPDKLIKFRPKLNNVIHAKFLQYYVSHGNARKYLRSKIKTTSGQNGIAGSDIKKMIVHLPSLELQSLIVTMIEEKISACDSIEQTVNTALAQADAMRQSILKEAFEGRLA